MDEVLCREFTPSLWSKRFSDRMQVLNHHLKHIETESEKSLHGLSHILDIPYGETEREKLDIFATDLPDDSPFVVFIHGGFWHELSREQSRYFAIPLSLIDFKTVVVGYDLCPSVTLDSIVRQIEKSIKFIFGYAAKFKSKGVYIIGHSAGAHLIAKALSNGNIFTENYELLKGAFLVSGIYDLIDLIKTTENDYLNLSLLEAIRLSPYYDSFKHLRKKNIFIYVIVAENDSNTFIEQSEQFYTHLSMYCNAKYVALNIFKKMDHFDIMETLSNNENYLKEILLKISVR